MILFVVGTYIMSDSYRPEIFRQFVAFRHWGWCQISQIANSYKTVLWLFNPYKAQQAVF